ncbi:MAG: DUF882 domain-containing protein [Hyphomicrobiales bacterium]
MASTAIAALLVAGVWTAMGQPAFSGGETRTLSLYHVHTRESLTVTYMVKGKYVPSALRKINYLMRDWRRNEVVKIDPETVDLMWELHADLGSQRPIHIICGYRSPKTNAFLQRIGRSVARKSQHVVGKAIDLYFPDVPTEKIRNSALVRKVGGVGYYRTAGGPTGFLHIDSGNVRQWGPPITSTQMARIFRDYPKTVGARLGRKERLLIAAVDNNEPPPIVEEGGEDDVAETASGRSPALPKAKPVNIAPRELVKGYPIPKPRPKPIEVMFMAAANMKIEPASAPPPSLVSHPKTSPVEDNIGTVEAAATMTEPTTFEQTSNAAGKGSLAAALRDGTADGLPTIRAIAASAAGEDLFWWPRQIVFSPDQAVRRDGAPQQFSDTSATLLPGGAEAAEPVAADTLALAGLFQSSVRTAPGKDDRLVVNRQGKGSLPATLAAGVRQLGLVKAE